MNKFHERAFTTTSLLRFGLHERSLHSRGFTTFSFHERGFTTFSFHERGFTLIELLIVIAIMAVVGTVTLANFGDFGEDQKLKSAVLDVQTQLRAAQTNATTNLKCNTQSSATWQVEYNNSTTINLRCQEPSASSIIKKTLTLGTNIVIQSVSGTDSSCPTTLPFTISFAPLGGKIDFIDGTVAVATNCTSLTITLRNTKTESTKSLGIEQGGRIYAQ